MADFCDIDHIYGNDLGVTPTGDIATVVCGQRTVQRVIRRLMTPATDTLQSAYPWEPPYGAGLPGRIGKTFNAMQIQAVVLSQLLSDSSVAPDPPPTVVVSLISNGVATIDLTYTDSDGEQQTASFNTPS
jgi:hypothetical protein